MTTKQSILGSSGRLAAVATGALVLAVLLAGCVTKQEREARQQANREARCASFGFHEGTPEFSRCLQELYMQEQQIAHQGDGAPTHCVSTPNPVLGTITNCF